MKKYLISIMILVIISSPAIARESRLKESVFSDYLNSSAAGDFINIQGLDFSSSMGVSFSSMGDQSAGMGYYMGHFNYEFSPSWNLRVDVGVSSMLTQGDGANSPQLYIPNIDLTYKPEDSDFMLRFQFRQYRQPLLYRRYR